MGLRRLLAVGAVGVAAVLGITAAAGATPSSAGPNNTVAPDSLRALAAKVGLRIGTAVIPFDLDHPDYAAVAANQQMLKACLAVRACISFTVWGFGDADSWVPGFFTGEGYATIYDVNLQPKPAFYDLQQDLGLAAHGAPHRTGSGSGF
jgi:Glycosyl hydrolase family 10